MRKPAAVEEPDASSAVFRFPCASEPSGDVARRTGENPVPVISGVFLEPSRNPSRIGDPDREWLERVVPTKGKRKIYDRCPRFALSRRMGFRVSRQSALRRSSGRNHLFRPCRASARPSRSPEPFRAAARQATNARSGARAAFAGRFPRPGRTLPTRREPPRARSMSSGIRANFRERNRLSGRRAGKCRIRAPRRFRRRLR